jgi:hypothetical protein
MRGEGGPSDPKTQSACVLKRNPHTSSVAPDYPATLFRTAVEQFRSTGQLGLTADLDACAAGGIINNSAMLSGKRQYR